MEIGVPQQDVGESLAAFSHENQFDENNSDIILIDWSDTNEQSNIKSVQQFLGGPIEKSGLPI